MVIVNTVVYVQSKLHRRSTDVPFALATFGCGSMLVALLPPRLFDKRPDRPAMLVGAPRPPEQVAGIQVNACQEPAVPQLRRARAVTANPGVARPQLAQRWTLVGDHASF